MSSSLKPSSNPTMTHSCGQLTFNWTINKYSNLCTTSTAHYPCFTSSTFSPPTTTTKSPVNHHQFRLSLFPKGFNANLADHLSIGLGTVSALKGNQQLTVRYRVSLINSKDERRNTKEWLYIFSSTKPISVFGRFIARSALLNASNGFVTDDKLVIQCQMTVLGDPTALDYANTNLADLKFIAKSQPDLMTQMFNNLASKHRLGESDLVYPRDEVPNFEIQNFVEETFSYSYKTKMNNYQIFTWTQSKYMKSTEELKLLSIRKMLDLLNFWMVSGTRSDLSLVFQCDQGEKVLNLHKIVLPNRSSAFDNVLLPNIVEKQENRRVAIPGEPSEIFGQLIHYLYTGKVPLLKQYQYELLAVSCKYGFDVLKQMCELTICDQIATESAIGVLILANAASLERLKQTALDFITDHATELLFDLSDSLKPELIGEMYRNLALKNVLNESEDRQVYENFQPSTVSDGIEESLSYTRLKMYHIFNEFTFKKDFRFLRHRHIHTLSPYESPEFCSLENPTLKFKLVHLAVDTVKGSDFDLMVKDGDSRRFDLSEPQVSLISYKMSLSLGSDSLGTCDDIQYVDISSNYSLLHSKLHIQNLDKLDNYSQDEDCVKKDFQWFGYFKIRSEITVLCGISALDMSPIQGFTQLELEQSRKHLLECINSSLLKSDDDKRDVTLVVRGTEFKVHSIFLAQSSVFASLVLQSNRISIPDLSIEAFEPFVQYLYTGKVQSLDKYAKELLIVARKYKLDLLVQMCLLQIKFQPN